MSQKDIEVFLKKKSKGKKHEENHYKNLSKDEK